MDGSWLGRWGVYDPVVAQRRAQRLECRDGDAYSVSGPCVLCSRAKATHSCSPQRRREHSMRESTRNTTRKTIHGQSNEGRNNSLAYSTGIYAFTRPSNALFSFTALRQSCPSLQHSHSRSWRCSYCLRCSSETVNALVAWDLVPGRLRSPGGLPLALVCRPSFESRVSCVFL